MGPEDPRSRGAGTSTSTRGFLRRVSLAPVLAEVF